MSTVPDFMPILSAGGHSSPKEGACLMEMASFLAGEAWSDSPACTHPILASVARQINDAVDDATRQQLAPLIPLVIGTAHTGSEREGHVLAVRLATWCARQVLHLVREQDKAVCEAAVKAAEGWCDGTVSKSECAATAATAAAYAAAYAGTAATYATYAAYAAAYAAAAAATYAAPTYAAYDAATYAAYAATYATTANQVKVQFLTDLIAEHARLTGHSPRPAVTVTEAKALAELLA